jgi:hypothetical protein
VKFFLHQAPNATPAIESESLRAEHDRQCEEIAAHKLTGVSAAADMASYLIGAGLRP